MATRTHGHQRLEIATNKMNKTAHVLVAVWLVVAAFVVYLIGGLVSSRESAEQRARDQALSYTRLVEQHALAGFDRANIALLGIIDHVRPPDLTGNLPDERREKISELLINQQQFLIPSLRRKILDMERV